MPHLLGSMALVIPSPSPSPLPCTSQFWLNHNTITLPLVPRYFITAECDRSGANFKPFYTLIKCSRLMYKETSNAFILQSTPIPDFCNFDIFINFGICIKAIHNLNNYFNHSRLSVQLSVCTPYHKNFVILSTCYIWSILKPHSHAWLCPNSCFRSLAHLGSIAGKRVISSKYQVSR